jgi:3-dehydroquinate dehydratase/shikimate dehydrogenase
MTHLCVSIYVNDLQQAQRDLAMAAERGAEMVELRVDTFTDPDEVKALLAASTLPAIVTCRSKQEGGRAELDDVQRLGLLTQAGERGASYLDIEWSTVADHQWAGPAKPRSHRAGWIYSSHNFVTRPANLHQLMIDLAQSPCDVSKVAWHARSVRDNVEAFDLMIQRQKPTIVICMGEAGMTSRILAKKFGAFLTFASLEESAATAPGQVTVDALKRIYRWDAQKPSTRVYGVVGHPVGHSMSPAIHNAAFDHTDFNGVYVPLLVEPSYESFKAFMEEFLDFEPLMLSGLSITIPHKENAQRYLQEKGATVEPLAERIGAVNTILVHRDGASYSLEGRNTDYAAILDSITSKLGIERERLRDYRVAVIGAGGTGRTAVAALASCGATVVVYNRTFDRAEALAHEFNGRTGKVVAARMEKLCDSCCQIYLNTTSLGMHPKVDASPFDAVMPELNETHLVFDTIYNPMQTKLLKQAQQKGARTIGGIEMFVRQAAAQFEAWTNLPAPGEVMRQVVVERLTR